MDIFEKIKQDIKQYDSSVEVVFIGSIRPSRTSADLKIVEVVTEAFHQS